MSGIIDLADLAVNESICISALPKYLQDAYVSDIVNISPNKENAVSRDVTAIRLEKDDQQRMPYFQLLLQREWLTQKMAKHGKCFPPFIIERAKLYRKLQYDDLASFDAFTVYTICQKWSSDEFVTDLEAHDIDGSPWSPGADAVHELKVESLYVLIRSLIALGATAEAIKLFAELRHEMQATDIVETTLDDSVKSEGHNSIDTNITKSAIAEIEELLKTSSPSRFGHSRREIYPWSHHEPDRNSPEAVAQIGQYLAGISSDLEAKVTKLPAFDDSGNVTDEISIQLGLFAKRDLEPGREVLSEKSLLTAIRPLEDAICDACGQELEDISFEEIRQCDGEDCDVTFCSADCKDRAAIYYHRPQLEEEQDTEDQDVNDEYLSADESEAAICPEPPAHEIESQDEQNKAGSTTPTPICGNTDLSTIGRPTNTETPEWDLYFLLLTRTVAMSITQDIHPLDLQETKFLWGDFNPTPLPSDPPPNTPPHRLTLPFSPLHNLQYTLDFFTTLSTSDSRATPYSPYWLANFDFWILQTLLAKFRGVANATQSTFDGKPEIASVHPGWCLANHSCDPNVRWTPKGVRKFFVRTGEERAEMEGSGIHESNADGGVERGEDDSGAEAFQGDTTAGWSGIKAGAEIFSNYTDIRLSVQERRERLREVLGGNCRCDRCMAENVD